MCSIVLGVEAGQDVKNNGRDGEELPGCGELDAVVHLLPVRQETSLALIRGLKWGPLNCMQKQVHHQVMNDVRQGPDQGNAEERDTEQDDVQHGDQQQVSQPDPTAVHHPCIGIHLAVSHAHIHPVSASAPALRDSLSAISTITVHRVY